jgi:hypothetical protein
MRCARTGLTSSSVTLWTAEQPPSSLAVLPVLRSRRHHCKDTGVLIALPEAVATRSQPGSSLPQTVTDLLLPAGSATPEPEAQLLISCKTWNLLLH